MMEENFSKACKEVLQVLKNIGINEYNKIPKEFIANLKQNADYEYVDNINFDHQFSKQELLPETIDLLAYIYRKFWCNEQEKIAFDKAMFENEKKYEEELEDKYNYNNIFVKNNNETYNEQEDIINLPVKHKENFFIKIILFFKRKIRQNKENRK